MKHLHRLLSAFVTVSLAAAFTSARADENSPPNVLFISIDDLNDWIGCMDGHPQTQTPNLDRLAERGVLFTNAHCAAPVCLASRTAVFSGKQPDETGVYSNWGGNRGKLPAADLQLPVHLAAAGYETLGTGKLYHSKGADFFDEYFETEQRWSPFTRDQARYTPEELPSKGTTSPRHVIENGPGERDWVLPLNGLPSERNPDNVEGESFDWGSLDVADKEMGDTLITDWSMEKLEEARSKPFFLGVGYYRPHIPLFAPQQDFDRLPPVDQIELPRTLSEDLDDIGEQARGTALEALTAGSHDLVVQSQQWKEAVRAYLACVTYVDRQIGRLVEQLDASAHADNTWIILWSDHGWHLGEKKHWGKWTGWRLSTRVPLIVVPPRNQTDAVRGAVCAEPVNLIDLYPTILELCYLPERDGLSGVSLAPLLANPELETDRAVVTTFDPGNHSLSTRDWRFIRYASGEEELYDIGNDPDEWRNLANDPDHHDKVAELRSRLDEELAGIAAATNQ